MPRVDADLKLDFKDVLFRPKRSSLKSRSEVGAVTFSGDRHFVQRECCSVSQPGTSGKGYIKWHHRCPFSLK
uniref:Uncharacterized protein n=1 Tax=Poecilia reticulata TaxID=8081 RepID=A0A3P9NS63_POERE